MGINRLFIYLSLISLPFLSLAQRQDTTKLITTLEASGDDGERLTLLLDLSDAFLRNNAQRAFEYAEQAQDLSESLGFDKSWADAELRISQLHWQQGLYDKSLKSARQALSIFEELDDSLGIGHSLYMMGKVDYRYGNYPQALDYHLQGLRLREHFGTPYQQAQSWLQIGIVRAEISNYEVARQCYDKAMEIAEAEKDTLLIGDILNHVARSWRKQKKYPQAIQNQEASRKMYEAMGDRLGLSDYYNNIGSIYRRKGELDKALKSFFDGLNIQKELADQEGLADSYNDIGTTYTQKKEYDQAVIFLKKGLEIAKRIGLKDDVRYAYSSLAKAYEGMGDYPKAVETFKRYDAIRDTLYNQESQRRIEEMAFQNERERARRKLELVQAQAELAQQRRRQTFLVFGAGLLMLLGFAVSIWNRARLQERVNQELAQKNEEIQAARERSDELLLNILPAETAEELKLTGEAETKSYAEVSVLFTDFKGFGKIAETMKPEELIEELDICFRNFDKIVADHGLEKIKTIGDAYMCVGGLPKANETHAKDAVRAGIAIQAFLKEHKAQREAEGKPYFEARLGIHTGPVVAGVVGIHKFAFDIWGDTVNTASRLESSGKVGHVNISGETYTRVKEAFECTYRGKVSAKNIGGLDMYYVESEIK